MDDTELYPTPDDLPTEQTDRSWRTGSGRALGTCGEVLSAVDEDGRLWRLSLPLQRVVVAQMRFRPTANPKLSTPSGTPRTAEAAVIAAVDTLGLSGFEVESVRGTYRSDVWNEPALGGWPASAAAMIRALSAAAGDVLDETAAARLLALAGLDPSPAYRTARLLDVTTGTAADAVIPRFAVTVAAPRLGAPRTIHPGGPQELEELRQALGTGDQSAVAGIATAHARRHAADDPALAAALQLLDGYAVPGLLGVLTGGPGGAIVLLFAGDQTGRQDAQRSGFALLGAAPGYALSVGLTPAG